MTTEALEAFIDEWLAAWTGDQPEQLLAYYTPNAFYLDPARPDGLQGHHAMRPYFEKLLAQNPDWVWQAIEVIPTTKGCTLKWTATIPTPKGEVICQGLDIVELQDGRISRNEVYFDRAPLLKAMAG